MSKTTALKHGSHVFCLRSYNDWIYRAFITHSTSSNMAEKTKTGHIVTAFSVVSRQKGCDGCLQRAAKLSKIFGE